MKLPPCLADGILCGVVAGVLGGVPSAILLTIPELDQSIRAIAHLVPGNARVKSLWGRRALGAAAHMGLSLGFASVYTCAVHRRPVRYGTALWAINIKLLAPADLRAEDRSYALADHLAWALIVHAVHRHGPGKGKCG